MKVDFYILGSGSQAEAWQLACEKTETLAQQPCEVYLYVGSDAQADQLDDFLWSFKEESFIPHQCLDIEDPNPPLVQIGATPPPAHFKGVLINLQPTLPAFYAQFDQVIEIVFSDPNVQQLARERYRHYREHGHELNTYKI